MSDDNYGNYYDTGLDGGYAEARSTSDVEGGANAQKTSGQGGNYDDRASKYSCTNNPGSFKDTGYNETSSRSYGDAGGPGSYNGASYNLNSSENYGDADGHDTYDDLPKASSSRYTPYEVTYRGTNDQGNRYDNRVQPSGPGYHYSNKDGSYYYKNGNNSTYYNDGQGGATYTAPDGKVYKK